jgi:hypothetical protein
MKQYRITSETFNQSESLIDDAYLSPEDPVHKLALAQKFDGLALPLTPSVEQIAQSAPVLDRGKIQREQNIKPGTTEWFKLWFDRPNANDNKI